ncbi:hypothetical protein [Micromonospora carbonacea]|uniref:Uncharacterized protein n=1 Tax=Micromonospora carbonacea TaxID=47853 RepID=A0A1C5AB49_9ACTN|nr:hypothetical protein [Micromonospora carbonacea]SCF42346.1 hypothetical protein GA0070563_11268 [Micromonospora carbonacea]
MKTWTIQAPYSRINQSIRDALGLDVSEEYGDWVIAAPSITTAVHLLRARTFPDWPRNGAGLIKATGTDVQALAAAGRIDREAVMVRPRWAWDGDPVAVVDKGGDAHRIGIINNGRFTPDGDHLTGPERAAMDAWTRGSADTTGMLYAVRAALAAAGRVVTPEARDRLARHLYLTEWVPALAPQVDAEARWDGGKVATRDDYLQRADAILAVITGKDT